MTMSQAEAALLARATPYLRPPAGRESLPEIEDGLLDLLGTGPARRGAQTALDRSMVAWLYDRTRERILPAIFDVPPFEEEMERLRRGLALEPGDVVLDLACGHGNFTQALAVAVGPEGLVIGVDLSRAMLERARSRVRRTGLSNVLLVWGDAHDLPIANGSLGKLNCSGGFHSMPDLPKALAELARAASPGARLTAACFAAGGTDPRARLKEWVDRRFGVNFVPLGWLGRELEAVGFEGYEGRMVGAWLGYATARKAGSP